MQQYGQKSKRQRTIKLILAYILMTLAVVVISSIAIMLAMGYRFNFERNQLEQGALVQLASTPSGATVYLDDEKMSFATPGKRYIKIGDHSVKIQKDGYRDWSKNFTIRAAEVRWLNYARLVPNDVETKLVKQVVGVASEKPSPNRRFIALVTTATQPEVTFIDIRDHEKVNLNAVVIPTELITLPDGAEHSFVVKEWSSSSRYVLVQHNFTGGHEYLRLNVEDGMDIVNLSKKFGVNLTDVALSDGASFYGLENGNIRRFDVAAGSLSEPIAQNVVSMKLHGNKNLVFVQHLASTNKYQVAVRINDSQKMVASYDATLPVLVDIGEYFNEFYIAISQGASFELLKNPERTKGGEVVVTLTFSDHPDWLDISPNGRFVVFGDEARFVTYDIELKTKNEIGFNNPFPQDVQPQWLDDYVLAGVSDGKLGIRDFDGDNYQTITTALSGHPATLSGDNAWLYSFAKSDDGTYHLQASRMILKN